MTEPTEVVPRPDRGPSSMSIQMWILPAPGSHHPQIQVEWPIEWRVPAIGEMLRFDPIGVSRVTHVLWDHAAGTVTVWSK